MGRDDMFVGEEVCEGYHHAIAALAEVRIILDLFGKDVSWIDDARYVFDLNSSELVFFPYASFV